MQVAPSFQQQVLLQVRLEGHGSWTQALLMQLSLGEQHCVLLAQALATGHSESLMRTQVPLRRQVGGGGGGLHFGSAARTQSIRVSVIWKAESTLEAKNLLCGSAELRERLKQTLSACSMKRKERKIPMTFKTIWKLVLQTPYQMLWKSGKG